MRLRDYSPFFEPEELDAMTAAYDAAWQHLRTNRRTLTAGQVQVLKKNLVQIILASACNGKRDVMRLKEIALRGVSGRQLHRLGVVVSQLLPPPFLPSSRSPALGAQPASGLPCGAGRSSRNHISLAGVLQNHGQEARLSPQPLALPVRVKPCVGLSFGSLAHDPGCYARTTTTRRANTSDSIADKHGEQRVDCGPTLRRVLT